MKMIKYDTTTELQNSYIKLQQQQNLTQKRHEVTTYSQQIIDSLKARIEELETDSIIKNQDIRKQSSEIQQLRQEIEEFNDFKNNFMFLYEEVTEMNRQEKIRNDRLLTAQLQID